MRSLGLVTYHSDVKVDDRGKLFAEVAFKSKINAKSRTFALFTGLDDTVYNRRILCPLILRGVKQSFNNINVLSKSDEGLESLFEQAEKIFQRVKDGSYKQTDRKTGIEYSISNSAPQIVYFLLILKSPNALTREQVMALSEQTFDLDWLKQAKKHENFLAYSNYKEKLEFKKRYEGEIYKIKALLNGLKSVGRL
jgi:hypothetical protein